jgi:hypothetical protein
LARVAENSQMKKHQMRGRFERRQVEDFWDKSGKALEGFKTVLFTLFESEPPPKLAPA